MSRNIAIASILCLTLILGAGCGKKDVINPEGGVNTDVLASLNAEEAANALVFKDGSSFVLRQAVVPSDGTFYLDGPESASRLIEIESFNPTGQTRLNWRLEHFAETDASKAAYEAFEEDHEDGAEAPKKEYEQIVSSGSLSSIKLQQPHELYLPVSWKAGGDNTRSSAIWVSRDAFKELSGDRSSTIYLDAVEAADRATLGNDDLQAAVASLRGSVRNVANRTDVDSMKAEGDVVEWPVVVNGESITVQAIKARNWFGEIVVLNNPQNPLILKFEFNPNVEGLEAGSEAMNIIRGLLGYEVTEITL